MKKYVDENKVFDLIYSVGSIYITTKEVSPAILFGGTWEQIQDCFLLGCGAYASAGSIGGQEHHSHEYGMIMAAYYGTFSGEQNPYSGVLQDGNGSPAGWSGNIGYQELAHNKGTIGAYTDTEVMTAHYKSVANTSLESHMPPYLAVYIWKRVE